MASSSIPTAFPLLAWAELAVIARLEEEREALRHRVERLPRHSHRRIELEVRLRLITSQQLAAEANRGGRS